VDTLDGIRKKLTKHYRNVAIGQLYKLFGSLNFIGNPIGLFRNIATGIRALKEKPSEGFVKGPLEFGMGLAGGTSSLFTNSIGGVLNSVEKVAATLASGLAVLAFDKEFEETREKKKMKKPKHVLEGLEKGSAAALLGLKQGISGVFTKPIEQTRKDGAFGFLKGVAKGVAGLAVKPVTGVIDFASKTTEGLKNTALIFEDRPNEMRIRYPRVFYTECSMLREYSALDSRLYAIISKTKYEDRYGFEDEVILGNFGLEEQRFLFMLRDSVVLLRLDC
jgi:vacuolar protein sorting-associated protein 13A/C